jgi:tetratricopeptide (TPR) repeat protein
MLCDPTRRGSSGNVLQGGILKVRSISTVSGSLGSLSRKALPAVAGLWAAAVLVAALAATSFASEQGDQDEPAFLSRPSHEELKAKAEKLERQVAQDSTSYDLQFELAGVYYDMGSLMMAAKRYEKAAEIDPSSTKALVNLGVVLNEMGKSNEAIETYRKALLIDPNDVKAICNMGLAYYGTGRYSKALDQYKTALKMDPKSLEAHYNLGVAFADAQIYREAIDEWNKVVEYGPDSEAAKAAKANIEVIQQLIELKGKPAD